MLNEDNKGIDVLDHKDVATRMIVNITIAIHSVFTR
jgi:hypothetical protein